MVRRCILRVNRSGCSAPAVSVQLQGWAVSATHNVGGIFSWWHFYFTFVFQPVYLPLLHSWWHQHAGMHGGNRHRFPST